MKGPRTRAAILGAAADAFCAGGYEVTTLEDIADRLDLSRGVVLFHFESKRALLMAIVEPLFTDLEALIDQFQKHPTPLAPRPRRQLLTAYCDLLVHHRHATILLVRDLSTMIQMHWPDAGPNAAIRMMALLEGPDADRNLKLRATSTVGGILRAVCMPPFDPTELDDEARNMIVSSALAAYNAKP
jgi:AcrR family transcriptional regulator